MDESARRISPTNKLSQHNSLPCLLCGESGFLGCNTIDIDVNRIKNDNRAVGCLVEDLNGVSTGQTGQVNGDDEHRNRSGTIAERQCVHLISNSSKISLVDRNIAVNCIAENTGIFNCVNHTDPAVVRERFMLGTIQIYSAGCNLSFHTPAITPIIIINIILNPLQTKQFRTKSLFIGLFAGRRRFNGSNRRSFLYGSTSGFLYGLSSGLGFSGGLGRSRRHRLVRCRGRSRGLGPRRECCGKFRSRSAAIRAEPARIGPSASAEPLLGKVCIG